MNTIAISDNTRHVLTLFEHPQIVSRLCVTAESQIGEQL